MQDGILVLYPVHTCLEMSRLYYSTFDVWLPRTPEAIRSVISRPECSHVAVQKGGTLYVSAGIEQEKHLDCMDPK